jgi:type II secretory pathway component GspD/PulD (secretin)
MARKKISRILSGGVIVACTVLLCTLNVSAQFQAVEVTHTISGSVGVPGVTMQGLPGNPTTDETGYYIAIVKWGWTGTVTPKKEGWTFEPSSKNYPEVASDQDNQDYRAIPVTYTISGSAGMADVRMTGLPGEPVTGSDGRYSASVEYGWTGTVVPLKDGYEFTPADRPYRNVGADIPGQDYTPKKITLNISGTTSVAGVEMQGLPGKVITDNAGNYIATVDWGWSGTVKPIKQGYTFMPEETPYTNLTFNQTNQDYISTPITYTISGSAGMANVEMKGFPEVVYTDASGYYTAVVNWGWSGVVTPQLDGFTFKPASITYSQVDSDRDNQNYTATIKTFIISGSAGQEGVQMLGLPGDPLTGPGGAYSVTVDWNWTGTVTPTKEGYEFNPSNKLYPPVNMDMKNQNYTASLKHLTISGTVEVPNVTLQGVPGRPVVSGSDGSYSVSVPWGWTGTITPQREGYEFNPSSMQYPDVRNDEIGQDYRATLLKRTISGTVLSDKGQPVEGVLMMSDLGLTTTTDVSGKYELEVDHGWGGMITPTSEGYTFRPPSQRYPNVTRDMANQNYQAIIKMFTITDVVTMNGIPIRDVKITATDIPGSTATDAQGRFTIRVPYGWTGEIIPTKPGINFNPPSKVFSDPITQNIKMGVPEPVQEPAPPTRQTTPSQPRTTRGGTLPPELPSKTEEGGTLPQTLPPAVEGGGAPEVNEVTTDPAIRKILKELEDLRKQQRGPAAPGVQFDPAKVPVSNTFAGEDLQYVFDILGRQAGIPIIPEASVYGEVYCTLDNVPLETALDIVLAGTPYVYKRLPHYYLVSPGDPNSALFSVVSETRPVKLDYVRANAAIALLSDAFLPYVKADPDPNSHTVLVTAPTAMMERIISDLEQVDQTPTHVMLDARIVVMERGDLLNLGIEWGWPTIQAGMFSNDLLGRGGGDLTDFGGKWPWGVQMGYTPDATFTSSLVMALNLLEENDEAKILSKPQLMALNGRQARIQVVKEEYYVLTSPQTTAFGFSTNYLQDIQSGTTLTITPYVGDEKDITLEMAVEVSDSVPNTRANDFPVVTRRTAENTVRIKDGGTAIVAGLTENRTNTVNKRVPGLSKLPLVGGLFNNDNNQSSTREIAVFITARIVPDDSLDVEYTGPSPTSMMQQQQPQEFQQPQYQMPAEPMRNDFQSSLLDAVSRRRR